MSRYPSLGNPTLIVGLSGKVGTGIIRADSRMVLLPGWVRVNQCSEKVIGLLMVIGLATAPFPSRKPTCSSQLEGYVCMYVCMCLFVCLCIYV